MSGLLPSSSSGRGRSLYEGALLRILTAPDPMLRQPARPMLEPMPEIEALAERMIATAKACQRPVAVGLAAPQVGESVRLFVWRESGESVEWFAAANPEIVDGEGEQTDIEGCLSLPGRSQRKRRAMEIEMEFLDAFSGELEHIRVVGFEARILQHEVDHLDGRLFIDPVGRR